MLRAALAADTPAVVAVFHAARAHALPYLPVLHTPEEDAAFFGGLVERGLVTVAELDGRVAGFLALNGDWVDQLYVDPRAQGRGLGGALLRNAQAQRERLQLWVFQRNTNAIAFYEHHGFTTAETTDGVRNEERTPDARMAWRQAGNRARTHSGVRGSRR